MTKLELWIGRVEVLTQATDSGDTKAFTNVITWANNADEFSIMVAHVFDKYGGLSWVSKNAARLPCAVALIKNFWKQ
jgi:hypothetical protein